MRVDARHCAESTPTLALQVAEKYVLMTSTKGMCHNQSTIEAGTPRNFASSRLFIPCRSNDRMERGQSTDIVTNPAPCRFGFSLFAAEKWSELGSIHHQSMARCHQRHFGRRQTARWYFRAAVDALQTYSLCAFVTQQQCGQNMFFQKNASYFDQRNPEIEKVRAALFGRRYSAA